MTLNTTVTVISTLQNSIVAYSTLQLTYLLIVGIAAQVRTYPQQHKETNPNPNCKNPGPRNLHLLDPPNPPLPQPQNNVQRRRPRHHPPRRLGHDRNLVFGVWLPPHLGSLGLRTRPSTARPPRLPLVQLQPDHDLGGHAAGPRVPVLQSV